MNGADPIQDGLRMVAGTRADELGCDECYAQLDRFAELVLGGVDAAAAMPLVQDHLERCHDCREEFEALLAALEATTFPRRPTSYPP